MFLKEGCICMMKRKSQEFIINKQKELTGAQKMLREHNNEDQN